MIFRGNVVSGEQCGFGSVVVEGEKIVSISFSGDIKADADWVLPGFIDPHMHGLGKWGCNTAEVHQVAEYAPQTGVTTFAPTFDTFDTASTVAFARRVKELISSPRGKSAKIAGSHLEGPFLDMEHRGGMAPEWVRNPDLDEARQFIEAADGTLKIMTLAPELPKAGELIAMLKKVGSAVSAGHCAMTAAELPAFIAAGGDAMCHLYDAYDGREVFWGVSQPALTDAVLIEDSLLLELILDGVHVPETLVKMTIRAAGYKRIVGITDAMQGAGMPDAEYYSVDGRKYTLTNGDVCRDAEDPRLIVGSCLTMNRLFYNLCNKFGFSPVEAAAMSSGNAARYLRIADKTGVLKDGFFADIVILGSDQLTVKQTICEGKELL